MTVAAVHFAVSARLLAAQKTKPGTDDVIVHPDLALAPPPAA